MKNLYTVLFVSIGLFLIGVGTYIGFENYNKTFFDEKEKDTIGGVYYAAGDLVNVQEEDNDLLMVKINKETYEFILFDDMYMNSETGFSIKFDNNQLILYKDDEIIRTLEKKYKNSIQN